MMGSAGASPAIFGAPPKTYDRSNVCVSCRRVGIVSREAHDTAGEAPALPRSCRSVFIRLEEQ